MGKYIPTEEDRQKAREAHARRVAEGRKPAPNPLERVQEKLTRQSAISAKCFDCEGQDADPAWRWRIGNCEADFPNCPLWPFRPYQKLRGKKRPHVLDPDYAPE